MAAYATPEEEWHDFLNGTHPHFNDPSPLRFIPSSPRCRLCKAPFRGPGALILRRYGFTPWEKNPKICRRCFRGLETQAKACPSAAPNDEIRGGEVELSMLFADVRGSSKLARQMSTLDFTRLMNHFYKVSSEVLIERDAIIEKFVGDEVVGLFVPFMTGQEHAKRAVEAAEELLRATGHGSTEGPWIPLGAGVHTGPFHSSVTRSRRSSLRRLMGRSSRGRAGEGRRRGTGSSRCRRAGSDTTRRRRRRGSPTHPATKRRTARTPR